MAGSQKESNEESETSSSCQSDILAMFNACGYHRVRVTTLNDYDRVVGGIAWAITRFQNVPVAADLLYDETDDKLIKVRTEQSEKIIEALEAIECPHKISAHQLLGLDYPALRNVVQWLLIRVLAQDELKSSNDNFADWFSLYDENEEETLLEFRKRLRTPNDNRHATTRHMKRFASSVLFSLNTDAQCTLAEYINYARTGESACQDDSDDESAQELSSNLEESSAKKNVSSGAVREMMEAAKVEVLKDETPEVSAVREAVCGLIDAMEIPERLAAIEDRLTDEAASFLALRNKRIELTKLYQQVSSELDYMDQPDFAQLTDIILHYQRTHRRARYMHRMSLEDYGEASREEIRHRKNMDAFGNVQKYCAKSREVADGFGRITKKFIASTRDVLALQYRLERKINETFNKEYRKRDIERMMQSVAVTEEMKMSVIDYNVTVDILTFSAKITGFMNEVEKTLLAQPASQEYRDAFVSYMNDVRTQLSEYHHKAKIAQEKCMEQKDELSYIRNSIRLEKRDVTYRAKEMKKLLDLNLALAEVEDELTLIEMGSPSFTIHASRQKKMDQDFEEAERKELAKRADRSARREEEITKFAHSLAMKFVSS